MEKSMKSLATNWGLYLGVILALLGVIGYVNLDLLTKWWFGISMLILIIVFGIVSSMKSKALQGGFISFKLAFTSFFITVALGLVVSTFVTIVIYNFVDPEAAVTLKEKIIDSQAEMMQNFGAPEEAIAKALEEFEAQENMFAIGQVLKSLAFQLIGYIIVGLIAALVIKKNNPDEA